MEIGALRRELRVPLDRGSVSSILTMPGEPKAILVLGHGAGGTMHTPLVASTAHRLCAWDIATLRYNFPFSEAGRRRPDFRRALERAAVAACELAVATLPGLPLLVGGKSLGGRVASHVVADGAVDATGLVLLGYPLHPPRRHDELRDAHLPAVGCPVLFVEGTRDPYAQPALLHETIERLIAAGVRITLHVIEGGDHDLRVPVRARRSYETVLDEVAGVVADWAASLVT